MLPSTRSHFPRLGDFSTEFNRALQTGEVSGNGRWVQEFERMMTTALGVPCLAFNNAQTALMVMLRAADVEGGEVILPSFTFTGTAHAIVWAGAKPVFADINPDTLTLDWDDAERKITSRTRAIMPVDAYGIVCEVPIKWRNSDYDILIDAAPAFGSLVDDQHPVKRGRAQVFSFQATKPFTTMEGGLLVTEDKDLMHRAWKMRHFGQDLDGNCDMVGLNGKMPEVCAMIGVKQFETWDYRAVARVESAARLARALEGIRGLTVIRAPLGQSPIWAHRPVLIDKSFGASRDDVLGRLRERGVMGSAYYPALHLSPCYASTAYLPVTEKIASSVISVPVYDEILDSEIEQIAEAFRSCAS